MDLGSFDEFINVLRGLSQDYRKDKKSAPLISPAVYIDSESSRKNVNVDQWGGWAAIDIDKHNFNTDQLEDQVREQFGKYNYVVYSTASSSVDTPKFRLVLELDQWINKDDIPKVWYALNEEIGQLNDQQTKDLSRMYYAPGMYKSAHNFFFVNSGAPINIDELLIKHSDAIKHNLRKSKGGSFLDRLPDGVRESIINHRKDVLESAGKKYSWNSYRDCPFVSKRLLQEYESISGVDGSGRYAMIYKMMVSIASSAIKREYPITEVQLIELIRQIDADNTNLYKKRRLDIEASRAISYAYETAKFKIG